MLTRVLLTFKKSYTKNMALHCIERDVVDDNFLFIICLSKTDERFNLFCNAQRGKMFVWF